MSRARAFVLSTAAVAAVAASAVLFACSQTPTSVPIRTFERAQKVDVICLRVFGENAPEPLKQEECAPVPPNVNGGNLDNQLFALVTQTSRGEVAVVDLSAGAIIDQSHAVPGLNFLPVGANPTDIAATPDGRMAFIASAEPNKFAIYGIPGHRILGDAAGRRDPEGAVTLSSWPVCALPQRPGSLTVVPRRSLSPVTADGGAEDAGAQAATPTELPYELVAVLPGDRTTSAKVITIDPRPFLRASPRLGADGQPLEDFGEGPTLAPGELDACPITAAMELVGESAVPETFREGKKWEDGVKWVDGGVDLTCDTPEQPASCGLRSCKCKDPTTGLDAGSPIDAGGGVVPACDPDAGSTEVVERAFELNGGAGLADVAGGTAVPAKSQCAAPTVRCSTSRTRAFRSSTSSISRCPAPRASSRRSWSRAASIHRAPHPSGTSRSVRRRASTSDSSTPSIASSTVRSRSST